jgi:putative thymidine phosphorylase
MNFILKPTGYSTGGARIVFMHKDDAITLGVHKGNRVKLTSEYGQTAVVVDISNNGKNIRKGVLGINEEVRKDLGNTRTAKAEIIGKPISLHYIRQKIEGKELDDKKIYAIIKDIVNHTIIDFEISYFVAAGHVHGFTDRETIALTKAMINTGEILKFDQPVYDKHCTGGVPNNRTTMLVVPIIASLGLLIPKTSSRSITSPAGTADTMEVLANVHLTSNDIKRIVAKENGCIAWGGAINLAPADDAIINVEHPLGLDARGQLIASVLAKKASVSAKHVLIDIPIGKDTKFKTVAQGNALKKKFELVGKEVGMEVTVILTNGDEPIGRGIGPALEARDILWILENDSRAPIDLRDKSCMMAGLLLEMAGKAPKGKGKDIAQKIISSGEALKKMKNIIKAQGKKIDSSSAIKTAKYSFEYKSSSSGLLKGYHTSKLSVLCQILGAPQDARAGVYLSKEPNSKVKKGDLVLTAYADSLEKMKMAKHFVDEHQNDLVEF